jgi:hypothetical protein
MGKLDLNAIIAFVQKNWPAVTAAAVILATLILMKRRKKPVAIASYPSAEEQGGGSNSAGAGAGSGSNELPTNRQKPFCMLKEYEQDIAYSKTGVAPAPAAAPTRQATDADKAKLALKVLAPIPYSNLKHKP